MIRALIFDFNGVLADDDPIHKCAFQRVAAEEGLQFTEQEYLEQYLHLSDWDCFKLLFSKHSKALPAEYLDDLIRRKSVYYFQAIAEKPVLFEGAVEAIRTASRRFPLAIASGARKGEIRHILESANLQPFFRTIVAAEDVENGKPHPEPFLKAYQKLREQNGDLAAAECVAIEDSIGGIRSAHEAGMRCLAIAHSYDADRLAKARPEWIIESIRHFGLWFEHQVASERLPSPGAAQAR